jgi:hypothetical protein
MKAFEEAGAVAGFELGVYAERVEVDHDAEDQLEVSSVAILLPQIDVWLAERLIDCEEDRTLRAVLVGMLREAC